MTIIHFIIIKSFSLNSDTTDVRGLIKVNILNY